jgi:hypothetical protein
MNLYFIIFKGYLYLICLKLGWLCLSKEMSLRRQTLSYRQALAFINEKCIIFGYYLHFLCIYSNFFEPKCIYSNRNYTHRYLLFWSLSTNKYFISYFNIISYRCNIFGKVNVSLSLKWFAQVTFYFLVFAHVTFFLHQHYE